MSTTIKNNYLSSKVSARLQLVLIKLTLGYPADEYNYQFDQRS
jgi:hypothetical protein